VSSTLARALIAALCGAVAAAGAHAAQAPVRYTCPADQDLTVQRTASTARVTFNGRSYALQRKHSSIGDKYLSANAALIIDGPSAVFVADGTLGMGACQEAVPVALGTPSRKSPPR
jgi:hypothetical protein